MKRDIHDLALETAEDFGALEQYISPESLKRFRDNDQAWPVELWMKVRDPEGNNRLEMVQIHPDPCNPTPGRGPMEREWMQRSADLRNGYNPTIRECPEQIIANCLMKTEIERMHKIWWENDNRMEPGYLKSLSEPEPE